MLPFMNLFFPLMRNAHKILSWKRANAGKLKYKNRVNLNNVMATRAALWQFFTELSSPFSLFALSLSRSLSFTFFLSWIVICFVYFYFISFIFELLSSLKSFRKKEDCVKINSSAWFLNCRNKGMCPKNNLPSQLALKLKWHKGLKQNVDYYGRQPRQGKARQGKWNAQMENAFGIFYPGFVTFIDFFLFSISNCSFVHFWVHILFVALVHPYTHIISTLNENQPRRFYCVCLCVCATLFCDTQHARVHKSKE